MSGTLPPTPRARIAGHAVLPHQERSVRNFAIKQGTHPGIVVARLQHDNHLKMSELNFLKAKMQL